MEKDDNTSVPGKKMAFTIVITHMMGVSFKLL